MSGPRTITHRDADVLAQAAAARLVTAIADAQAERGTASIVLTGGGVGTAVLAALGSSPARDAVDWRAVDVWWGDERFLPAGDPERNETGAREALLDRVDVDPGRVHAMPASDGPDGDDVDAAARRYADELAAAGSGNGPVPAFDVLMLGVGPDAHVASLFPGMPQLRESGAVVPVRDAPKPPPTRISLTYPSIGAAREVWLLAAGEGKADAVRRATAPDAAPERTPVVGARGRERTLFLVDLAAAGEKPGHR
ncbi:6-phosphogluconolactonase [Actinomadura algeriensis]|uniref:6-phosphogluconolactonase n=1 Tax=Actinomadura algeriensis TaxID=1679523 RepID=A0ABR9JZV8_9ACTN|nr:6-phosphogluconolactonase [Actinomadura algeriensis]MBE1536105.1 6-phosphogluconolactonase [Actinomadura algeriensis]